MNYPDYEAVARKVGHMHLSLNERQMTIIINACAKAYYEETEKAKTDGDESPHAKYAESYKSMWAMLEEKHKEWSSHYHAVEAQMIREAKKNAAKERAIKAAITRMVNKAKQGVA